MNRKIFRRGSAVVWVFIFLSGLVWTACSSALKEKPGEGVRVEETGVSKYKARYYHFDDVLIPGELEYQQNKSFIYETPNFKAGVMFFSKWRLEPDSLVDFFTYNMQKDNWELVNSYKGKESILNFSKRERTCTIKITETWSGATEVEIRVGQLGEKKM